MREFIENIKQMILQAKKEYGGIYIAIIDMGESLELEVEYTHGDIAGNWTASEYSLEIARKEANELEKLIFEITGAKVFKTREEWENATFKE